uniref:Uncharacterized protein n=1 Tax=Rhizophora mucronata TaxID=61149 RepID=A0A2P2PH80_RHIMU
MYGSNLWLPFCLLHDFHLGTQKNINYQSPFVAQSEKIDGFSFLAYGTLLS